PYLMSRVCLSLACLLVPGLLSLRLLGDAPGENGAVAFRGATLHTAAGKPISGGVLVIEKGKIVAVGDKEMTIPKGARLIDARGQVIIPGLVDTHSHIGI